MIPTHQKGRCTAKISINRLILNIDLSIILPTPHRPSNPQPAQARSLTTRRINRGKAHPGNSLLPLEPRGRSKCAPRPPMKDPERDGTRLLRRWAKRLPILIGSRATRCLHMASPLLLRGEGGRGGKLGPYQMPICRAQILARHGATCRELKPDAVAGLGHPAHVAGAPLTDLRIAFNFEAELHHSGTKLGNGRGARGRQK